VGVRVPDFDFELRFELRDVRAVAVAVSQHICRLAAAAGRFYLMRWYDGFLFYFYNMKKREIYVDVVGPGPELAFLLFIYSLCEKVNFEKIEKCLKARRTQYMLQL
jgi:hypothetical protein